MIENTKIESHVTSSEQTKKSQYYQYVLEVETLIKTRFPYGAINRVDVVDTLKISEEEQRGYYHAFSMFSIESDKTNQQDIFKITNIVQPLIFGNCGIFVNYAIGFMKKKYPQLNFECLYLKDHVQLVIGRNPKSSSIHFAQWGKDTVVYDIWAKRSFLAVDLENENAPEKQINIPFYSPVIDHEKNQCTRKILNKEHYLLGKFEIITGGASELYDQMLIKWVEEDQKRFKQPFCIAPKNPLLIKEHLDSTLIKDVLQKLSKCSGWKFSVEKNVAWLECKDKLQAERITKSLKSTKAVVATLCTRTDTQVSTVKCEYFNLTVLNKLATALTCDLDSNLLDILNHSKIIF